MKTFALAALSTLLLTACVSQSEYDKLSAEHLSLVNDYEAQGERVKDLDALLSERTSLVNELQQRVGKAASRSAELDRSLAETRQALGDLAQRKADMEHELREIKNLQASLKSLIDTGAVQVRFIKGRMVVTLGSDVFFRSGSAALSSDGQKAIKDVTTQLARIPGKEFQIEGHTDNVPIKTAEFPSNWALASARSLTVLNTMVGAGMPADRVSAASYGEMQPAVPNDTPESRAKNRRIDIVVVPDLTKLLAIGNPTTAEKRVPAAETPFNQTPAN